MMKQIDKKNRLSLSKKLKIRIKFLLIVLSANFYFAYSQEIIEENIIYFTDDRGPFSLEIEVIELKNNEGFLMIGLFDKDKNKFNIKGSSYSGEASSSNVVGNWWNHKILQADSQISPISGSIKKQVVSFVGKEIIEQNGQTYEVDHFKLNSKDMSLSKDKRLDFNIWFDKKNFMIIRVSYSRMGNWEYRLKNVR